MCIKVLSTRSLSDLGRLAVKNHYTHIVSKCKKPPNLHTYPEVPFSSLKHLCPTHKLVAPACTRRASLRLSELHTYLRSFFDRHDCTCPNHLWDSVVLCLPKVCGEAPVKKWPDDAWAKHITEAYPNACTIRWPWVEWNTNPVFTVAKQKLCQSCALMKTSGQLKIPVVHCIVLPYKVSDLNNEAFDAMYNAAHKPGLTRHTEHTYTMRVAIRIIYLITPVFAQQLSAASCGLKS